MRHTARRPWPLAASPGDGMAAESATPTRRRNSAMALGPSWHLWGLLLTALGLAVLDAAPATPPLAPARVGLMFIGCLIMVVHGRETVGTRAVIAFVLCVNAITIPAEAIGVHGDVFALGHRYSQGLGPRIFDLSPVVQLGWMAMGYASFVIARAILGARGRRPLATATVGAIAMVGWDLAQDPLQSTVRGDWVWQHPGAYFGVPVGNFIGWFCIAFAVFAVYELWMQRRPADLQDELTRSRWFESAPVFFYLAVAAGIVATPPLGGIPNDPAFAGYAGSLDDLATSTSVVAVVAMGGPATIALLRNWRGG